MANGVRLRKTLTPNDLGATGSHQAGLHIPKALRDRFPALDESRLNPDVWLDVDIDGELHRWRFIHYNNRLLGSGTRDEYRLTHATPTLRALGAAVDDTFELVRIGETAYACRLVRPSLDDDVLTLSSSGPWRVVGLRQAR